MTARKSAKAPGSRAKPAAKRGTNGRLTDAYAAEARRDTLLKGDELSELEAVGQKPKASREK